MTDEGNWSGGESATTTLPLKHEVPLVFHVDCPIVVSVHANEVKKLDEVQSTKLKVLVIRQTRDIHFQE